SSKLGSLSYQRDANGRVTRESQTGLPAPPTHGTQSSVYHTTEHITTLDGVGGYTYDAANELTSSPNATFGYAPLGDRTATTPSGGNPNSGASASFTYDGDGLRTSKSAGSTTTSFTWDPTASVPTLL